MGFIMLCLNLDVHVCKYWYNLDQVSRAHSLMVVLPFDWSNACMVSLYNLPKGDSIFVHFRLHYSDGKAQCAWFYHALVCAQMVVYEKVVTILCYFNVLKHNFFYLMLLRNENFINWYSIIIEYEIKILKFI